jgi:hypothetical protein
MIGAKLLSGNTNETDLEEAGLWLGPMFTPYGSGCHLCRAKYESVGRSAV